MSQHEIGPSTLTAPARQGPSDPGLNPEYGPAFVRFVTERFAAVEVLMSRLLDAQSHRPREGFRRVATGQTDGSGNVTITLFETAPGQKFALHRLYVGAGAYTWAAPYTGGGSLQLNLDSAPWDGLSLTAGTPSPGGLPCVFSAGRLQGVEAQDGETLSLQVISGPASTRFECRVQGVLTKVDGDDR